jgi:hypothetical protein
MRRYTRTRRWRNISLTTACGKQKSRVITEADLLEAAGDDLNAYMLAELNRAIDHAVEDRG